MIQKQPDQFTNGFSRFPLYLIFLGMLGTILLPLFKIFPTPSTLTGHPWKVELLSSLFLFFIFLLINKNKSIFPSNIELSDDLKKILIPFLLFIAWSGISLFWADSGQSVLHHTFVWLGYFYLFVIAYFINTKVNLLRYSLISLCILTWIISLTCLITYIEVLQNSAAESQFRSTFSKFSEILIILTPFFFALTFYTKKRIAVIFGLTSLFGWMAIIASLSRTSFFATIISIVILVVFSLIFLKHNRILTKVIILSTLFVIAAICSQTVFSTKSENATLYGRIASTSNYQLASGQIRYLLNQVSFEMIAENSLYGVGADNYGININKYRAVYSNENPDNRNSAIGEDLMLERAHNEFLQIFAELGIIGLLLFTIFAFFGLSVFYKNFSREKKGFNLALKIGAVAGLTGFLISSAASSFSFRAMQNGLVFFIILSIALLPRRKDKKSEISNKSSFSINLKPAIAIGILFCFALMFSSLTNALSLHYLYLAEKEEDFAKAENLYKTAIYINSENASAYYNYGIQLLIKKKPELAVSNFQNAINYGLSVSSTYSYLATSQILSQDLNSAEQSLRKALEIYPNSVFVRVRLALLLEQIGKSNEATEHLEIARNINLIQTNGWISLINEGSEETGRKYGNDPNIPYLMDLYPTNAIYAIIDDEIFSNRFPQKLSQRR